MKDERYWPVLGTWLKDTAAAPPDPQQTARKVAERIPETPQVRRRWWLPSLRRTTIPPHSNNQPSPIPATNGHTPTVLGRTQSMLSPVKAITAGAVVFALGGAFLIAQPFDQQGGSVPGAATSDVPATTVSGEMYETQPSVDVDGEVIDGLRQDQVETAGRLETTDDRLSGEYTEEGTMYRYQPFSAAREGAAEVWYGTIRVVNDGGAWDGVRSSCWSCGNAAGGTDESYVELVGSGGYDGLSAILFVEGLTQVNGVIVPGDLPSK